MGIFLQKVRRGCGSRAGWWGLDYFFEIMERIGGFLFSIVKACGKLTASPGGESVIITLCISLFLFLFLSFLYQDSNRQCWFLLRLLIAELGSRVRVEKSSLWTSRQR